MKWLAKFERLKELDEMIVWPQSDPIEGKNAVTDVSIHICYALLRIATLFILYST